MIMKNSFYSVLAMALSTGALAQAADVGATKTVPMLGVLPNFYSLVDLRHMTSVAEKGDQAAGTDVMMQGRYTLGSTFLNGAVDANVTVGAIKETQTAKISQRRTYSWLSWTALEHDNGTILPYADIRLPHKGSGTDANLGVYTDVKKTFPTVVGSLTAALSADGQGNFGSREAKVEVAGLTDADKERFNLAGADKNMATSEAAGMVNEYGAQLMLADAAKVKGLKLKFVAYVDRAFTPEMKKTMVEGEERIAMAGYKADNSSFNYYRVDYKIGETGLTLTNETWQNFTGVFAGRVNSANAAGAGAAPRWINMAKVTKTL